MKTIIEDLHESSKLFEAEREAESSYKEMLKLPFDEVERLNKQLQEPSSSSLKLASKLGAQEEVTKELEIKVAELVVQMEISSATFHQKLEVTAEVAAPQASPAENVSKLENVSMN